MSHKTARQWLETLVAFDTTSVKSNIALIECVASYLESCGVKPLILRSPDGIHANLLATLPAADGNTTGGLILSGHSDVVPVAGQKWDTDPFKLTERDGKLYGRGSCDMKGYIAIVLSLVPEWLEKPRSKPLHIALTHSEETNLSGVRELIKSKGTELAKCDGCIIGEPTSLDLVVGHKGIYSNRVSFTGKSAHSSLQTDGYNAIEPASRLLTFLFGLRDRFAKEGPFLEDYKIPHTTLCPSIVEGGIAMNTIPDSCTVGFEFRNVPNHNAQEIQKEIFDFIEAEQARARQSFPEATITTMAPFAPEPRHFAGDPNWQVAKALQAASYEKRDPITVNYYTEASTLMHSGVATVVWGPGDIAMAHKANEYMPIAEFEKGRAVLDRVVRIMCLEVAPSQL